MEISELHTAGRRFGGRVLFRRAHEQLPAGGYRNKDDPYRKKHQEHDYLEGNFRRPWPEQLSRFGENHESSGRRAELFAMRFAFVGRSMRRSHLPVSRGAEQYGAG